MMEQSSATTQNGHEIALPRDMLSFDELRQMTVEYGLAGNSPAERFHALQNASAEITAMFLTDLNRRLQGSEDTLVHDAAMKIGEQVTIAPDDRYNIFKNFINTVQHLSGDTNPGRVGDALALATVLLHPFKDGNGRTARVVGLMFKDYYDAPDAQETFEQVVESRDKAREEGRKTMIVAYVPGIEGADRQDPQKVAEYLNDLVTQEDVNYMGLGGEYSSLQAA